MPPFLSKVWQDERLLGELAMRFRGTRDDAERQSLVEQHARTVHRLIDSGAWVECPPPEDQLPDDCMPPEFWQHWAKLSGTP
jgi:hypothetical protein